jgi:hypothetical protein
MIKSSNIESKGGISLMEKKKSITSLISEDINVLAKASGLDCSYYEESNIWTVTVGSERYSSVKGATNFEYVLRNFMIPAFLQANTALRLTKGKESR